MVLERAMSGTVRPDVLGTMTSGTSPTNSTCPDPVTARATVRTSEKPATMPRVA